jgi:Fic family protein
MDIGRLERSPIGRLVPISGYDARFGEDYEHWAYAANPLPSTVELSQETWAEIADGMLALGRLDLATTRFPNPTLLVRPVLRREAVSTSALEGTFTELDEVLAADLDDTATLSAELREVVNAIIATEYGADAVRTRPISVHFACELQEILIRGTKSEATDTGRVRTGSVFIGRDDQRVPAARFIPCPAGPLLEDGIREWERWINADDGLHLLVKTAMGHYQFEALHPFHDGNGRVGRILAILQLLSAGALHYPNLGISDWLASHDDEYRDGLAAVSVSGGFDPWILFFTRAIAEQAKTELNRVERLEALREGLVTQVRTAPLRGLAVQIAEDLIGMPYIRVGQLSKHYGVSYEAANNVVAKLVDLQILSQVGDRRYDRLFYAPEVAAALRV